jgi:hypothetical protein
MMFMKADVNGGLHVPEAAIGVKVLLVCWLVRRIDVPLKMVMTTETAPIFAEEPEQKNRLLRAWHAADFVQFRSRTPLEWGDNDATREVVDAVTATDGVHSSQMGR